MLRKYIFLVVVLALVLSLSACGLGPDTAGPSETGGEPVYNQAFISDRYFEHYDSMSLDEIRTFLAEWNSSLQGQIEDVDGQTFEPAQIIYGAGQTHHISPKVLLVTMEKEQRAITSTQLAQNHLALLMGAGSPSTAKDQILYAAQLFRSYLNDLDTKGTTISGWKVGAPKLTEDGVQVTPVNRAVAALFTYTPYAGVQWGGNQPQWGGNYLFYDAWYNKFHFGEVSPPPTPNGESKGIKITADDLLEEYEENEIAADHNYKNHTLIIVGKITDISREPETNKAYVSVYEEVRCFFNNEDELLELAKGEEIIVKGKCLGKKEEKEGRSSPIVLKNCSLIEETEFQLIDWKVIMQEPCINPNNVYLEISYKKFGRSITFQLVNPKGIETSMQGIGLYWTEGKVQIRMTERDMGHPDYYYKNFQTPLSGTYQLLVEDSNKNIIATKTFSFTGVAPEIEITGWKGYWDDLYYISDFFFKVKNTGDLPFCICAVETLFTSQGKKVKSGYRCRPIGDKRYEYTVVVPSGEEKNAYARSIRSEWAVQSVDPAIPYYYGKMAFQSPGIKRVTLKFLDGGFEPIHSTTIDITVPEKPPVE